MVVMSSLLLQLLTVTGSPALYAHYLHEVCCSQHRLRRVEDTRRWALDEESRYPAAVLPEREQEHGWVTLLQELSSQHRACGPRPPHSNN